MVVVVNLSATQWDDYRIGMPARGLWKLELNSDAKVYGDGFSDFVSTDTEADGDGMGDQPTSALVSIAPYSVLIYSLT